MKNPDYVPEGAHTKREKEEKRKNRKNKKENSIWEKIRLLTHTPGLAAEY